MESPLESPLDSPFESPLQNPVIVESDGEVNSEGKPAPPQTKPQEPPKIKPNFSGNPLKRQRKLTSSVWDEFVMIVELHVSGKMQCKCIRCGVKYIAESSYGTGNMRRHIKNCKGRTYRDIGQLILQSNASSSLDCRPLCFKLDEFRELLALAIARHNLPLQFVEYEGVRNCFSYLNPEVKFVSRVTIASDISKLYLKEKSKLYDQLNHVPGRISLTSDCWTSVTTDGYISLTAHFVDKHWRLEKRILAFTFIPPPHTGAALAEKMTTLLKQWGIENKVSSITLDNASCNDSMVEGLKYDLNLMCNGDYFHVRCCAHILNLIVQEGLKEIDGAVVKVRECAKYCKGSQGRKHKFRHCVQHVNLDSNRGLRQDVPTRWNSTFIMLDSALFYKKAFLHLQKTDANFIHCPNSEEWNKIEKICKFLQVFHGVTLAFSGTKYPTSNLYFPNVVKIRLLLKEHMASNDRFLKGMAGKMFEKFDKYWSEFSTIMAVAVVFDPRYKFQVIDWAFKKVYDTSAEAELELFKGKLFALFDEYSSFTSSSFTPSTAAKRSTAPVINVDKVFDTYMEDFDCFDSDEFAASGKSQLQLYLEEQRLPRTSEVNVLEYWKNLQGRYPIVARMARDILAIPISTVASESAFSIGGKILDAYRSSLKPTTVESLVCIRDWVFRQGSSPMQSGIEELCQQVAGIKIGGGEEEEEEDGNVNKKESGTNQAQIIDD